MKDYKLNLSKLFDFVGFKFNNEYALISITGSSYAKANKLTSQDTLAIIGDHVLKLIVSSHLLDKEPNISKNTLTHYLHQIECNSYLQSIGKKNNIDSFVLQLDEEDHKDKKLATTIEAIIGAIFKTKGYKYALKFIKRIGLI